MAGPSSYCSIIFPDPCWIELDVNRPNPGRPESWVELDGCCAPTLGHARPTRHHSCLELAHHCHTSTPEKAMMPTGASNSAEERSSAAPRRSGRLAEVEDRHGVASGRKVPEVPRRLGPGSDLHEIP